MNAKWELGADIVPPAKPARRLSAHVPLSQYVCLSENGSSLCLSEIRTSLCDNDSSVYVYGA